MIQIHALRLWSTRIVQRRLSGDERASQFGSDRRQQIDERWSGGVEVPIAKVGV